MSNEFYIVFVVFVFLCYRREELCRPQLCSVAMEKKYNNFLLSLHLHHTSVHISPLTVVCFVITMCWWVIGLLPAIVLCGRYFYSRRVIHGYLEHAMSSDMGDIEGFYTKSPGVYCLI